MESEGSAELLLQFLESCFLITQEENPNRIAKAKSHESYSSSRISLSGGAEMRRYWNGVLCNLQSGLDEKPTTRLSLALQTDAPVLKASIRSLSCQLAQQSRLQNNYDTSEHVRRHSYHV